MEIEEYKRRFIEHMVRKANCAVEIAQKDFDDYQDEYRINYPEEPELAVDEELEYWADDEGDGDE